MSILDGPGLKKLQENLLSKGDQNKIAGLSLSRVLVVANDIQLRTGNESLRKLISLVEDQQMIIGGRSRKEFLTAIENMPKEIENLVKK